MRAGNEPALTVRKPLRLLAGVITGNLSRLIGMV